MSGSYSRREKRTSEGTGSLMETCKECGVEMVDITDFKISGFGCRRYKCPECGHAITVQIEEVEDL